MPDAFRFGSLVERGLLDAKTAQYVLRTKDALLGMPKAGRQGSHREFSLRQAMQVAICTHLVKAGVPVRAAAKVVRFCEREALKNQRKDERFYASKILDPWILTVDDGRYCKLWREQVSKDNDLMDEDDYFDIDTGDHEVLKPFGMTRYQLNVTQLEHRLWAWSRRSDS